MARTPQPPPLSFRAPPEVRDEVQARAARAGVKPNQWLLAAIVSHLDRLHAREARAADKAAGDGAR